LIAIANGVQKQEDEKYGNKNLPIVGEGNDIAVMMSSAAIAASIQTINDLMARVREEEEQKKLAEVKKKLTIEEKKMLKYEQQEEILGERNSYNKTDPGATGMYLKNGKLAAAYNVQVSSNNQFVVGFSVWQKPSDGALYKGHMEKVEQTISKLTYVESSTELVDFSKPTRSDTADAAYGTEENYNFLEKRGIVAYVKYSAWYSEIKGQAQKKKFYPPNWPYDAATNSFTCPNNQTIAYKKDGIVTTKTGYTKTIKIYESKCCDGCPFAEECKKGDGPKTVTISPEGERYKAQARDLLASEEGKKHRSQRGIDIESVFGNTKQNMKCRRLLLRGVDKVTKELRLVYLGHNMRKLNLAENRKAKEESVKIAANEKK
jgi:hypothetical protein